MTSSNSPSNHLAPSANEVVSGTNGGNQGPASTLANSATTQMLQNNSQVHQSVVTPPIFFNGTATPSRQQPGPRFQFTPPTTNTPFAFQPTSASVETPQVIPIRSSVPNFSFNFEPFSHQSSGNVSSQMPSGESVRETIVPTFNVPTSINPLPTTTTSTLESTPTQAPTPNPGTIPSTQNGPIFVVPNISPQTGQPFDFGPSPHSSSSNPFLFSYTPETSKGTKPAEKSRENTPSKSPRPPSQFTFDLSKFRFGADKSVPNSITHYNAPTWTFSEAMVRLQTLREVSLENVLQRMEIARLDDDEQAFVNIVKHLSSDVDLKKLEQVSATLKDIHQGQLAELWSQYQQDQKQVEDGLLGNTNVQQMQLLLQKRNDARAEYLNQATRLHEELGLQYENAVKFLEKMNHLKELQAKLTPKETIDSQNVDTLHELPQMIRGKNDDETLLLRAVSSVISAVQNLEKMTEMTSDAPLAKMMDENTTDLVDAKAQFEEMCKVGCSHRTIEEIERNKRVLGENLHKVKLIQSEFEEGKALAQKLTRLNKERHQLKKQSYMTQWELEELQRDNAVSENVVAELTQKLSSLSVEKINCEANRAETQDQLAKLSANHPEFKLSSELFGSVLPVPPEARIPGIILDTGKVIDRTFEEYDSSDHVDLGKKVQLVKWQGKTVVLKELGRKGFLREAGVLCRIKHPNVIQINAAFFQNQKYYIEMPFYSLGNLEDFVPGKPLEVIRKIFKQLADALLFLSREEVHHGDLSLRNVVLKDDPTAPIPLLIDFEAATRDFNLTTTVYNVHATMGYLPPEVNGPTKPNEAWDVWSMGVMLYKAVIGDTKKEIRAIDGTIFDGWKDQVDRLGDSNLLTLLTMMLDKNPDRRYTWLQVCHDRFWFDSGSMPGVDDTKIAVATQAVTRYKIRTQRDRYSSFTIQRSNLIESVGRMLYQFNSHRFPHMYIRFEGEDGIDGGGLKKELVTIYFRSVFMQETLFESFVSSRMIIPVPGPYSDVQKSAYQVFGKMIAWSMLHEIKAPRLPWILIKHLNGGSVQATLMDADQLDAQLASSWKWMLVSGDDDLEAVGGIYNDEPVNVENVRLHVHELMQHRMIGDRLEAYNSIKEGFVSLLPPDILVLINTMTFRELDTIINGQPYTASDVLSTLNLELEHTEDKTIQTQIYKEMFEKWETDPDQALVKFVVFCTGGTGLPSSKIALAFRLQNGALPSARTCFSRVEVALYGTVEETIQKWELAMENSGFFGLA